MAKKANKILQSVRWDNLYMLLKTTHFTEGFGDRNKLVETKQSRAFAKTHIRDERLGESGLWQWQCEQMPLVKLQAALLQGCTVGHNGSSLNGCLSSILATLGQLNIGQSTECDFIRDETTARLVLVGMKKRDKALALFRELEILKVSDALIEGVGETIVKIEWFIPLKREA